MWFLLTLTSSFVYSLRSILEKKYIASVNKYILAFCLRAFALPFFVIPFLIKPELMLSAQELPPKFWLAIAYVSIATPLEMIIYYAALREEEVTFLIPLLAASPLFTTCFNLAIFRQFPTPIGLLGMLFIISGIYLLKIKQAREGILEPFRHLIGNRAVRSIAIIMLIYSLSIVIDKVAIINSNVYFYAFINYLSVSIVLFIVAFLKARRSFVQIKEKKFLFFILGVVVATYTLFRLLAISLANPAYVSAIMSSSVIFTIFLGAFYLRERERFIKITVGFLIFIGLVLIKLYG